MAQRVTVWKKSESNSTLEDYILKVIAAGNRIDHIINSAVGIRNHTGEKCQETREAIIVFVPYNQIK